MECQVNATEMCHFWAFGKKIKSGIAEVPTRFAVNWFKDLAIYVSEHCI